MAIETRAEQSRAASPRIPAVAYCQGTLLRNEIEARDAGKLEAATDYAASAIAASMATARSPPKFRHTSSWLWPRYWDVRFWHLASIRCVAKFGRFQTIADVAEFWREMARSRMTQSGHQNHTTTDWRPLGTFRKAFDF